MAHDVDAGLAALIAIADVAPRLQQRGPEVIRRMSEARAKAAASRRQERLQAELDKKEASAEATRLMFPDVAVVVGLSPHRCRGLTCERALAIIRQCFSASSSLRAAGRFRQLRRWEGTCTKIVLDSTKAGLLGPGGILDMCAHFKGRGFRCIVGYVHEWDETKQWLRSLVPAQHKSHRMEQLLSKTCLRFQQMASGDILVQRGKILVHIFDEFGSDDVLKVTLPWSHPPIAMSSKSAGFILDALSKGMPFDLQDADTTAKLLSSVDMAIGIVSADKASPNVSAIGSLRSLAAECGGRYLWDERFCELHNLNNLKASNQDYKWMVKQLYTLAQLMRNNDYVAGAVQRVRQAIGVRLRWHAHGEADPAVKVQNRHMLDQIFGWSAAAARPPLRGGGKAKKDTLTEDLESLLQFESGVMTAWHIDHVCTVDPITGRSCCGSLEDCRYKLEELLVQVYFGRAWPLPAESRFTAVKSNEDRVSFLYMHHNMLQVIIAKPEQKTSSKTVASEDFGTGLSDYTVVQGIRKKRAHESFVEQEEAKWKIPIHSHASQPLDELITRIFGKDKQVRVSLHDMLSPHDSFIAHAEATFFRLLAGWADDASGEWSTLDAVGDYRRNDSQDMRRFARRQLLKHAAAFHRRVGIPFSASPFNLHKLVCEVCAPGEEAKDEVRREVLDTPVCDLSVFALLFRQAFPSLRAMRSRLAAESLRAWETLFPWSTKASECEHARGRRVLGACRKAWDLGNFSCRCYLDSIREHHQEAGGTALWQPTCLPRLEKKKGGKRIALAAVPPQWQCASQALLSMSSHPAAHAADHVPLPAPGDDAGHIPVADVAPAGEVAVDDIVVQEREEVLAPRKRAGLNPMLCLMNSRLATAKRLKGSKLSAADIDEIRSLCFLVACSVLAAALVALALLDLLVVVVLAVLAVLVAVVFAGVAVMPLAAATVAVPLLPLAVMAVLVLALALVLCGGGGGGCGDGGGGGSGGIDGAGTGAGLAACAVVADCCWRVLVVVVVYALVLAAGMLLFCCFQECCAGRDQRA